MSENEIESNAENSGPWRVLDAALNRAHEGIRVVEDYSRLILEDRHLSGRLKQLRHDLQQTTLSLSHGQRIASRDTRNDVGTGLSTASEYSRRTTSEIVQANLSRVQQALRTIEEYGKLIAPELVTAVEQLRYSSYTLEKALLTTMLSQAQFHDAHLYVLIDGRKDSTEFENSVRMLLAGKVDIIQLRDKTLSTRELLERGRILCDICRPAGIRWIMNDRADLALAAGADGVHVGQQDLSVAIVRRIIGPNKMIGVSTHSLQQAQQAVLDGANYIGIGPLFPSRTKSNLNPVGLEFAADVIREIKLPAFAIGGISLANLPQLISMDIRRIAVKGAIMDQPDPQEAALQLKNALVKNLTRPLPDQ